MGLNRVGGDTRAVAKDLGEQGLAVNYVRAAAAEVLEDRGFLPGQADPLFRITVNEQLCTRPEGIEADREEHVLAPLVLAQLRP